MISQIPAKIGAGADGTRPFRVGALRTVQPLRRAAV